MNGLLQAFCAGGDVKQTVLYMRAGHPENAKGYLFCRDLWSTIT